MSEVVELLAHQAESKGLELIVRADESLAQGPGAVIADPARVLTAWPHALMRDRYSSTTTARAAAWNCPSAA